LTARPGAFQAGAPTKHRVRLTARRRLTVTRLGSA
jgi:hypothetical protein